MKIREIHESDWDQVYQLMEDNMLEMQLELELKWDGEAILNFYKRKSVIVIEQDHNILGFIAFHQSDDFHFIDSLQVAKQHQNRLLGGRLLKASLLHTQSLSKVKNVRCCVFENNPAESLYYAAGFQELSRTNGVLTLEAPLSQLAKRLRLKTEHTI
ncbi:GNAT family N-acetyltransferase [Vibrio coralliilyticus]|uniref:GNAT family N-acetyltransferase n=1 Tax=Vibrio coralliilyticus TaxID=190893 RepID=UPI001560B8C3|nr:GNAT family N-acetyltransferase [Vibrio coralliilyticus]NRF32115.1 GNAT family N-acetyltransferase [Vibrio coralliilyticus]NRF53390.1 GNAT family N-acetyltransferase [Vibrio coralliilyticus]NRG05712.1 GNAT family N-acetyltransferase [Vibrio coralliilyticus]